MKQYNAPSVKKAFAILNAISASKEGLGVSELAKKLKMAKSTVHGMTSALEELGAVMRNPVTKKYKLGFTLLEIGRSAYSRIDLKTAARPVTEYLKLQKRFRHLLKDPHAINTLQNIADRNIRRFGLLYQGEETQL